MFRVSRQIEITCTYFVCDKWILQVLAKMRLYSLIVHTETQLRAKSPTRGRARAREMTLTLQSASPPTTSALQIYSLLHVKRKAGG